MNDKPTTDMSLEDRLKAIVYQFILLHDRWAEERQIAAKQGADMTELLKLFIEQIKGFKELEPQVRRQIAVSVEKAVLEATQKISDDIVQSATESTKEVVKELSKAVKNSQQILNAYQAEVKTSQWKIIGFTVLTTITTCLLLVKFLIPDPTLPLTDLQVNDLQGGQIMRIVWPTLSKAEQKHWLELVDQAEHPKQTRNANDNTDSN